ncbi:unnamed protein product [Rangifer tarandus platyrhynchus]|uniref:Uncharacterized protein n=1 Tax=Rangifer tarandus platyrhynchus TaxID=3082113 RepID=A0AC59Y982_RANTA
MSAPCMPNSGPGEDPGYGQPCVPDIALGECPVCAVSYWVSTCHVPGLMLGEGLISDKPSTKGSGACQTLCLLSSQDVSSPHWLSTCHMPGPGLGEHPLCARLCDGCCRQEASKHLSQTAEQVRVGQPQAASGALKPSRMTLMLQHLEPYPG